jgi:FKBP-type peptidyl-prolyl cis-trans isomerase FkpA
MTGREIFSPAALRRPVLCRYTGNMQAIARVRPLLALGLFVLVAGCNNGSSTPTAPDQSAVAFSQTDLTLGTGAEATVGTTATVQYGLWLYSANAVDHKGTQIQANTFSFVVGDGTIIKGFDQGVTGMKVGGIRRLIIPPSLAYGTTGDTSGAIPPNAALVFDVQLGNVQ